MCLYLQESPARVQVFDAFQVARRQLDIGRTKSGCQLVHVSYVALNRRDLFLELLRHTHQRNDAWRRRL